MTTPTFFTADIRDTLIDSNEWENLWKKTIAELASGENKSRLNALPISRVKKIMKIEETVKYELQGEQNTSKCMIASEAPILLSKACELLIKDLSLRSWWNTMHDNRKTLQKNDVHLAVSQNEVFDFLIDIIRREPIHQFQNVVPNYLPQLHILPHQGAMHQNNMNEDRVSDQQSKPYESVSSAGPSQESMNFIPNHHLLVEGPGNDYDSDALNEGRYVNNDNISNGPQHHNLPYEKAMLNRDQTYHPDEYSFKQLNAQRPDEMHDEEDDLCKQKENGHMSNAFPQKVTSSEH